MKTSRSLLCAIVGAGLAAAMPAGAVEYSFHRLATLGGALGESSAINNAGQVSGSSIVSDDTSNVATVWTGTVPSALGMLPGWGAAWANDINQTGQVAGVSAASFDVRRATLWNGRTATDLGTLGGNYSEAYAINDVGQVVGVSTTFADSPRRAILWSGGTATDLGTLGGSSGQALGLNNGGQVVGWSSVAGDSFGHATLWQGGTVRDLGTLGGDRSTASDINGAGQIVGSADLADSFYGHAALWNGTTATATDLGTLGGTFSYAYAINETGQVVGTSSDIGDISVSATLWSDGTALDLNSFLDAATVAAGWKLLIAYDINDHGAITGRAVNDRTGADVAFVLSPVPEPEAIAMLLAGLGFMGLMLRVRNA